MTRLCIALLALALPLSACSKEPAKPAASKPDTSTAAEPAKIENKADAIIIDVRTQEEWDAGHLENAVLIPHEQIGQKITDVTADKDQPIYLHCRSGGRAGKAKDALEAMGYTNVTNLGGLEDAREHFKQESAAPQQ